MKHVKLFESFNGEKTKITINFGGSNPYADWDATAIGISKNPDEAAFYASAAALRVHYSNERDWKITSIEDARKEVLEKWWNDNEGLNRIIKKLKKGKIDTEAFQCDYGDSTVERLQTESPDMGLIIDFTVNGKDELPSNFNPGFESI
jgi:hypothetical protein